MLIGLSNVFGMAGLYVPFVYLVDFATQKVRSFVAIIVNSYFYEFMIYKFAKSLIKKVIRIELKPIQSHEMYAHNKHQCSFPQGIDQSSASYLISIIGITNTFGRVLCGYVADFPWVNSLLMNNICLVISTVAVGATPFCTSYAGFVTVSIFFGIAVCEYMHYFKICYLGFVLNLNNKT